MDAYFLIEGGRPLEMVKQYIADKVRVAESNAAIAAELGVTNGVTDMRTGVLISVVFPGAVHPDFTKPDRHGNSWPKKKTEWEKRFEAQEGYQPAANWIATEFKIPGSIEYETADGGTGWKTIGTPFTENGFLYLSAEKGPYAMWVVNVPAIVASMKEKGYKIKDETLEKFQFNIPGCRLIEKEEWELLVAQDNLERKRKQSAMEVATAEQESRV